jgi:hypothetical protein
MEPGSGVQGGNRLNWPVIIASIVALVLVVVAGVLWMDRAHDQQMAREAAAAEALRLAEEERARAEEVARIAAEEEARATAEQFVRGATQGVQYEGTQNGIRMHISWQVQINSLNGSWAWNEQTTMAAADNSAGVGVIEDLNFIVDSTQLSHPLRVEPHEVQEGWFQVVMECHQLADCISVQGQQEVRMVVTYGETQSEQQRVSERRSSQFWVYRDRDSAERAARALADLLQHAGAPEKVY